MSNTKQPSQKAQISTETPVDILTGLEPKIAEACISAAVKYGPAVGRAIYKSFIANEKLFIQIDASWKQDREYCVAITFINLTEHGIYLEDITTDTFDPLDSGYLRILKGYPHKDFSTDEIREDTNTDALPALIKIGIENGQRFTLHLSCSQKSTLPKFNLIYSYTELTSSGGSKKDKSITLRQKGPRYTA